jgi:hypothetical protein
VLLGAAWVTPVPGGLVEGSTTDANTGSRLNGVSIAITGQPAATATSAELDGAGNGFYYLFSNVGQQTITGTLPYYDTGEATIRVAVG